MGVHVFGYEASLIKRRSTYGIFSGFGNHNDTDRIYGYFPELSGGDGEPGV